MLQGMEVRRRYSEFASLRATLVNLHPILIIPPIPEKHTMADYAAKPTRAKEDQGMVRGERRHGRARSEGMGREEQGARTGAWMGESKAECGSSSLCRSICTELEK